MDNTLSEWHVLWAGKDQKAYYDIYWIMRHCLGIGWTDLQVKRLDHFSKNKQEVLKKAIAAYHEGVPLAYILENVDFYNLNLYIQEGVLIPRMDTESMVSEILKHLVKGERILELGTGNGAIACVLAYHNPEVSIVAVDLSDRACEVARKNVLKLGLEKQIEVIQASWYDLPLEGFDWVVANPPYIAKDDSHIEKSVLGYEPKEALFSENDGYQDLLYIIENAHQWLSSQGYIALEHGFKQQDGVCEALASLGYSNIFRGKDHQHPRFVIAHYGKNC